MTNHTKLLKEIRACIHCEEFLPLGPRPVVNFHPEAKILLVGQAPGTKVHASGIPWDDASGERLREWLDLSKDIFYDPKQIAIVPMGFCYPGKGKSGDLPPRAECSELWMQKILKVLPNIKLKLLIGKYSQNYFLEDAPKTLTETVRAWRSYKPKILPLPHPSPRNNIWLKKNTWFEEDMLPYLKQRTRAALR